MKEGEINREMGESERVGKWASGGGELNRVVGWWGKCVCIEEEGVGWVGGKKAEQGGIT